MVERHHGGLNEGNYQTYHRKTCALTLLFKPSPPQHPVALALYDAVQKFNIPLYHFKRMVDARVCKTHELMWS